MHANFCGVPSYFQPPLRPTLAKQHDEISLLTNFSKLKFNHRFRCPFGRLEWTPTFTMFIVISASFNANFHHVHFLPTWWNLNLIIDLDAHLIEECAHHLSQNFELFWPPLWLTITKPHNIVSLLTNFSELMFDHRFHLGFTFEQFLSIEI